VVSFVDATAVTREPHHPDGFRASIPEGWSSPFGLHGGVFAATVARAAAEAHHVDGLTLRSVQARYLDRPSSNELLIDTEVLRTGGISAFVEASARAVGQDRRCLRLGALFTREKEAAGYLDATPPDVPPVEACTVEPIFRTPPAGGDDGVAMTPPPLFDQLEIRPALGKLPWEDGWEPGQPARYVRWGRFVERPELAGGGIDPLCMLVYADLPAPALWVRLRPEDPFHTMVSLELSFHVLERPTEEWLCCESRARWMGDGYVFTETDIWSGSRLCAASSQMMLVRVMA
jgi:hypothetical protein